MTQQEYDFYKYALRKAEMPNSLRRKFEARIDDAQKELDEVRR